MRNEISYFLRKMTIMSASENFCIAAAGRKQLFKLFYQLSGGDIAIQS